MFWIVKGYDVNKYMEKSQELFLVILLYQKKILDEVFQINKKIKILLGLKKVRVLLLCFVL